MECPNCGQENREVARFCQYCGTPLEIAEPAQPEETPEIAAEPALEPSRDQAFPDDIEPLSASVQGTDIAPVEEMPDQAHDLDESLPPESAETPLPEPIAGETDVQAIEYIVRPEVQDLKPQVGVEPVTAPDATPDLDLEQHAVEMAPEVAEQSELYLSETEDEASPEPAEGMEPVPELTSADEEQPAAEERPEAKEQPPTVEQEADQRPSDRSEDDQEELADARPSPGGDESADLEALAVGTILDGHYRVIEVTETQPTHILYRVRDLQRCPRCGAAGHSPDEAFCTSCGALMDQKPVATMLQQPASSTHKPERIEPEDHWTEAGASYWIWRESASDDALQATEHLMRLIVGMQSDTGQVRELDEDSMFALSLAFTYESVTHQLGLYIMADGMGGHEGGEVASRLAIQTTSQVLLRTLFGPEMAGKPLTSSEILDHIAEAIHRANDEVYLERQKRDNDMGTTVTVAFIKDWILHLGHVGDCRAYSWGQEGLMQLTTDHSIVAGMVAAGTIQPEEIYTHPQRSVIYRCIGDHPTVEVDVSTIQLDPGERLLVCCDGLWEELRNEGIEDVLLAEADPQTACDLMVHQANLAGGSDNISVIIVQL